MLSTLSEKDSFFFSPETTRGQRMRKEDSEMGPKEGAVGVAESSPGKSKTFPKGILCCVPALLCILEWIRHGSLTDLVWLWNSLCDLGYLWLQPPGEEERS